jgi:Cu+-exporting ATPase
MSQTMKQSDTNMPKHVFHIEGMHCGSCVARIEQGLKQNFPELTDVRVNLATGQAILEGQAEPQAVIDAVDKMGYQAGLLKSETKHTQSLTQGLNDEQVALSNMNAAAQAKNRLSLAIGLTIPVFLLHMSGWHGPSSGWLQFVLSTPVLFYCGQDIFKSAFKLLMRFDSNMDTLIALGAGIAWAYSTVLLIAQPGHTHALYFETAAMIVTLILLGRYLEAKARGKAGQAIQALMELQPNTAWMLQNGQYIEIPVEQVPLNATLMIRPGSRIPLDGLVLEGDASVNESMMTGESLPVHKKPGEPVIGGTVNQSGNLIIQVTHVGNNTILARMIDLVENAQTGKPPIQRLADKIAGIFVPIILLIALGTAIGWVITGHAAAAGVQAAIAVLVIACPCTLGLATPTAIQVGLGRAASEGILIRDTDGLELAHKLDVLVFDKTGTLTQGKPNVVCIETLSGQNEADCVRWAAALESRSEHPLGKAIIEYANEHQPDWHQSVVQEFHNSVGAGILGTVDGHRILLGKPSFLVDQGMTVLSSLSHKLSRASAHGQTSILMAVDHRLAGAFFISDTLKSGAAKAIRRLKHLHIRPVMLSGDRTETAIAIGKDAGLSEADIKGNVSPQDKLDYLKDLQHEGKLECRRIVGMVGDGINDAPALAQADVSIAIGTGTEIAMQTAQMTLVHGDITKAVDAILLSRAILKAIRQNLFWAFFYNIIAIPAAALGYLNPMIAAAAMSLSSVTVVLNSLRLRRVNL